MSYQLRKYFLIGKTKDMMKQAYQLFYENKYDEALEKAQHAIEEAPKSSEPFNLMCKFFRLIY